MTDLPDLGPGWDWLQLTIPIPINHVDVEQIAHEAADAARAALDRRRASHARVTPEAPA
jgi:hypothetical protein